MHMILSYCKEDPPPVFIVSTGQEAYAKELPAYTVSAQAPLAVSLSTSSGASALSFSQFSCRQYS